MSLTDATIESSTTPLARRTLRVLLVSPVGQHGGAEQVFLLLAKHLPDLNVEPYLACLRPGPLTDIAARQGLRSFTFREHRYRQIPTVIQGAKWLARLAKELKVDVLHSNHAGHIYGGLASRFTGIPEIWHLHDYPNERTAIDTIGHRLPIHQMIFTTKRAASGYPGLKRYRTAIIAPAALEPERLRSFPPVPDIRARQNLPDGPLFVTVARLQEYKGHKYLLYAIPEVLKRCPEAVFAIVGEARGAEQEAYLEGLKADCERLGIAERVKFLGYVSEADLIALYREATALVHPALFEGFGLVLVEAMAVGAPVIAAASDGPRGFIVEGENGLLVPIRDGAALAKAIIRVLENPRLADTLRRGGLHFVDSVNVEQMARQTAEVYRELAP